MEFLMVIVIILLCVILDKLGNIERKLKQS